MQLRTSKAARIFEPPPCHTAPTRKALCASSSGAGQPSSLVYNSNCSSGTDLAHTGLSQQHRIVLGAPRQDLHGSMRLRPVISALVDASKVQACTPVRKCGAFVHACVQACM